MKTTPYQRELRRKMTARSILIEKHCATMDSRKTTRKHRRLARRSKSP